MRKWSQTSKKGKRNRVIAFGLCAILVIFIGSKMFSSEKKPATKSSPNVVSQMVEMLQPAVTELLSSKKLDVKLINQIDEPKLAKGSSVTSLAMILQYNEINVGKATLAEALPVQQLDYSGSKHGNPDEAFVGDIYNSEKGYGVNHGPIANLAKQFIKTDTKEVVDFSGEDFDQVIAEVKAGNPVWVMTTTTYGPTDDMQTWKTKDDKEVKISWSNHCVVVTGFNRDTIFINDPYGDKDKEVDRNEFIASWNQMGNQALVVRTKG